MTACLTKLLTRDVARDVLRAASVLLLLAAPALAQDTDEDGTLPSAHDENTSEPASSAPGVVGVSAEDLGDELLDPTEASLLATDVDGPTLLDMEASPSEAMFVTTGTLDLTEGEQGVALQGAGQFVLQPGFDVTLEAAPEAAVRLTLLVLHAADADLHELVSGGVAPVALVAVGDLPSLDVGTFQDLVTKHADGLAGLHVTVVDLSLDLEGGLHLAAVRVSPDAEPIEFVID